MLVEMPVLPAASALDLELHVIRSAQVDVVFHPPSLVFFKVNRQTADLLSSYSEGHSLEECAACYGSTVAEVEALLQTLKTEITKQAQRRPPMMYETELLGGRLVLLISQDCNLRCRYCNAGGGDYGQGRRLMSPELVVQTVEAFTTDCFLFEEIQFFGGEPSLNVPGIRATCEHLAELGRQARIPRLPSLTLITNGIHLSEELIHLINQYNIHVTFSLDGPPQINDALRVDKGGLPTYARVVHSLRRLQERTSGREPEMIEATVTKHHLTAGITPATLVEFFATELGVQRSHNVVLEGGYDEFGTVSAQERTAWLVATHKSMLEHLAQGKPQASNLGFRTLKKLIFKKISPYLCPIGISSLTVNADGAIYPCYQLMNSAFCMGSIYEPQVWRTERYRRVEKLLRANSKFEHPQCRSCWARGVCAGCIGETYAMTGSPYDKVDAICTGIRQSLEVVLCGLAQLHSDKAAWQQLVQTLKQEPYGRELPAD